MARRFRVKNVVSSKALSRAQRWLFFLVYDFLSHTTNLDYYTTCKSYKTNVRDKLQRQRETSVNFWSSKRRTHKRYFIPESKAHLHHVHRVVVVVIVVIQS